MRTEPLLDDDRPTRGGVYTPVPAPRRPAILAAMAPIYYAPVGRTDGVPALAVGRRDV